MKPKDSRTPRKSAGKSAKSAKSRTATSSTRKTKAAPAAKKSPAARLTRFKIPPILLEGDSSPNPVVSGPGQRYALGPGPTPLPAASPTSAPAVSSAAELPESYGTRQLFLEARDPHWVYAHWDFSRAQLKEYNALAREGHLTLRVHRGAFEGETAAQVALHPESRTWFVPVPAAGAKYVGELGYFDAARQWVSLSRSLATFTPPDSLSEDTALRFATIPPEVPFARLLSTVKSAVREHVPLVEAMQQMRAQGYRELPTPDEVKDEWTPTQEKALAEVISMDKVRRIWIGSMEITELIRRQLEQQVSSMSAAQFSLPGPDQAGQGAPASVSSAFGGEGGRRGFWFNVNAELIIYGATEPDAKVTIGDRPIKLRPDGSFSYRFALPDGMYELAATAHSADGEEARRVDLYFSRATDYRGDVGTHPQDEALKPPLVSSVA